MSGYPVSGPRFEHRTSWILSTNANQILTGDVWEENIENIWTNEIVIKCGNGENYVVRDISRCLSSHILSFWLKACGQVTLRRRSSNAFLSSPYDNPSYSVVVWGKSYSSLVFSSVFIPSWLQISHSSLRWLHIMLL